MKFTKFNKFGNKGEDDKKALNIYEKNIYYKFKKMIVSCTY